MESISQASTNSRGIVILYDGQNYYADIYENVIVGGFYASEPQKNNRYSYSEIDTLIRGGYSELFFYYRTPQKYSMKTYDTYDGQKSLSQILREFEDAPLTNSLPEKTESTVPVTSSNTYSYEENYSNDSNLLLFIFAIMFLGVVAFARKKSNLVNNNSFQTPIQNIPKASNTTQQISDPIAVKRIDLGLELNSIMEGFMKDDPSVSDQDIDIDGQDYSYESPNANEILPKAELLDITTKYLKIRGINPNKSELNDILDEERSLSENISIASAYYDSSSKEFIIENLTDKEVEYLLTLCALYHKNEPDAVKTIHYLLFGEPFEKK